MSNKVKNIFNTFFFMTIFIGVFTVNLIISDKDISVDERRNLKHFPEFSWAKVWTTKLQDEFDDYALDQFVGRDYFRKLKTTVELEALRKMDNNGLFVYDGHILKNLYPLNEREVELTISKMNEIYDSYLTDMNVYYSIIPDKNYYLSDALGYLKLDYNKLISMMHTGIKKMKYIDIMKDLNLDSYYKTDIHWRQDKLHDVLTRLAGSMDFEIGNIYEHRTIEEFKGSYYGQLASNVSKDKITYLVSTGITNATVYNHEKKTYSKVYDMNALGNVDRYDIFLSGPTAVLDIENPLATTDKELIIFRDSFGSSLTPLLIDGYRKITVIDIRYINSKILDSFIEFNDQDILFIYSVNIINNGSVLK